MSSTNSGLQTWNGDPKNLPIPFESFVYKDNEYYWEPCNCRERCKRPKVYKDGKLNLAMTIRMRGDDQGNLQLPVILKVNGWTAAELADKLDAGEEIGKIFGDVMDKLNHTPNVSKFLEARGLSEEEVTLAAIDVVGPMVVEDLMRAIVASQMLNSSPRLRRRPFDDRLN